MKIERQCVNASKVIVEWSCVKCHTVNRVDGTERVRTEGGCVGHFGEDDRCYCDEAKAVISSKCDKCGTSATVTLP
jgi:hypothetical protein